MIHIDSWKNARRALAQRRTAQALQVLKHTGREFIFPLHIQQTYSVTAVCDRLETDCARVLLAGVARTHANNPVETRHPLAEGSDRRLNPIQAVIDMSS